MGSGGFDAVLGNPPWERIKLQEQEFFASRDAEIAEAPNAAARTKLITRLKAAPAGSRERRLHDEFEQAKRAAEASSVFARVPGEDGGRFPLTGRGDVNTYALFAEHFTRLVGTRGRAGVIVPTGIATDSTTAPFFSALVNNGRLASLFDFENKEGLFASVHRSYKFCLLTTGHGLNTTTFAFFLTNAAGLTETERVYSLSSEQIRKLNPNTRVAPALRSRTDSTIVRAIYERLPVLVDETANAISDPWNFRYMTKMFDMADSSDDFRTSAQMKMAGYRKDNSDWIADTKDGERYIPLYEAKMVSFYDHRAASYAERGDDRGFRVLPETSDDEHKDPNFEVEPYYWINAKKFENRIAGRNWPHSWILGWKDVAAVTNERTVTVVAIPRVAVGHTFRVMFVQGGKISPVVLLANLASLPLDYIARLKFGGLHLTVETLKQLPVLPPNSYGEHDTHFVVSRVLELTYTSHAMAPFARELGFKGPPFAWDEERRALLRAELDAFYARAYGLNRDELRYILDPPT